MKAKLPLVIITAAAIVVIVTIFALRPTTTNKPTVAIFNLMSHPILDDSVSGIKEALADAGFGPESLTIIEVNANGEMDKLNAFANELLAAKPYVMVPVSTPVTQAVFKEAQPSQKIIFSTVTNPEDVGMGKNPPNMSGVCDRVNYQANLDLIFDLFPKTKTIGIIYNAGERNSQYGVDQIKQLVEQRDVRLRLVTVSQSQEVVDATRSLIGNVDVIYVGSDNTVVAAMGGLTRIANSAKLPVIASDSGSVHDGALAAVSVDYEKLGRRAGELVAQVLREGQMPKDRDPVLFLGDRLLVNKKAAAQLGFEFPQVILDRAQEIIR
ncbi:MAG: ABC transporter substrate-binding protein [Phycisphaerales bacterium]|nr:ABC transporter substrate-binding protein [Phycisphaerales bacterium]MCB9856969.1 ABC transporter substrate-binding protein [Phycisphaerales bacterium]MCB9861904.1 ABC transporter substrate-binding protein [Phycisphaerales bacterium]